MFQNSHFAIATHALVALAIRPEARVSSSELAGSINTNPAFLRTILGRLKVAGLIDISLGKGGGNRLARPAREITLLDVHAAVDPASEFRLHQCEPNADCMVGKHIFEVLEDVLDDVQSAIAKRLERRTIADLARSIRKLA